MVHHIVTFRFRGTEVERHTLAHEFKNALDKLPAQISVLECIEVGINQNPAENDDLVLTAVVPTMCDVALYANHPAHLAAASIVKGRVEHRSCVDYEVCV